MKTEELKSQGLTDEQISFVMSENGKDIKALQTKLTNAETDRDAWKAKAETAEETLKSFEGIDPAQLQGEIQRYKDEAERIKREYEDKETERVFEESVKEAIGEAKGKNATAIRALLDLDTLKKSRNQKEDIKKALDALREKEDSSFLFVDEEQEHANANAAHFTAPSGNSGGAAHSMSRDEIMAIKDPEERQAKIAENISLFRKG